MGFLAPLPFSRQQPPVPLLRPEGLRRFDECLPPHSQLPPAGFLPPSTVHATLSPPSTVAARWPDSGFTVLLCRGFLARHRDDCARKHMAFPTVLTPSEDFPSPIAGHASRRATSLLPLPTCPPAEAVRRWLSGSRPRMTSDESPLFPRQASIRPDAPGPSRHFLRDQPCGLQRCQMPKHPPHRSFRRRLRRFPATLFHCRPAVVTSATGCPATACAPARIFVSPASRARPVQRYEYRFLARAALTRLAP
jgi:hypothetical protein